MACSTITRICVAGCAGLPTKDQPIANVADIAFVDGATGVTISWSWGALGGTVAIVVIDATLHTRDDYEMVDSPIVSHLALLADEGDYFFMVRREEAGEASPWDITSMAFRKGVVGDVVEHSAVEVIHDTDEVLHFRIDQFLLTQGEDTIITQDGDDISISI